MYQVCYTRYHVSFYLWLIGSVLKHCKVPKYYEQDRRQISRTITKIGLPSMKKVFKPLVKSVLIPLELTSAAAGIHKKS